ncbi:multidrug transporter [Niallia circulans]|nr:multidrug transporter [Niallia circulans]
MIGVEGGETPVGLARQSETLQAVSRPRLCASPTESEPPKRKATS